jgi:hypothetical protein
MILQLGGLGSLIGGITEAALAATNIENEDLWSGKFEFWYQ